MAALPLFWQTEETISSQNARFLILQPKKFPVWEQMAFFKQLLPSSSLLSYPFMVQPSIKLPLWANTGQFLRQINPIRIYPVPLCCIPSPILYYAIISPKFCYNFIRMRTYRIIRQIFYVQIIFILWNICFARCICNVKRKTN